MKTRMTVTFFVSTGFLSGLSPKTPGTVGTIVCVALWGIAHWLGLGPQSVTSQIAVALGCTVVGLLSSRAYLSQLESLEDTKTDKDPQVIVIDEWAGMLIALVGVPPHSLVSVCAAFALFRIFDIMKPGPVRWAESLPREWGIMFDDVVAGVLAAAVMHLLVLP